MSTGAIGSIGSLTDEQQAVCKHLPQPIASVWQEVLLARTHVALEQQLIRLVDVTTRTLSVLTLTDYLRGPPVRHVEALLGQLDAPEPEVWFSLLNAGVDAIYARTEPKPFCLELLVWAHGPRGEPAKGQRLLEKALELRQHLVHASDTLVVEGGDSTTERLLGVCLALCESLSWLGLYRLVRPAALETLRQRGFSGKMQLLTGGAEASPTVDASWTAHLVLDSVYWAAPDASAFLEVSPLMRVLPHPRLKRAQCFLLVGAPHMHRLQLRHDATEVTLDVAIPAPTLGSGEWTFTDWLAHRAEHDAYLENTDLGRTLAVDESQVRRTPSRRPPSRPIPDLSADAFREPTGWRGRQPSSAFTPEQKRQRQAVLLAQVAVLLAIVAAGARMLRPVHGRERAVHIDDQGVAAVVAKTRGANEDARSVAAPQAVTMTAEQRAERARAEAREAVMEQARQAFAQGQAVAATQPVVAVLKWEVASFLGDWHGDLALTRLLAREVPVPKLRCQRHALRALEAQPGDGELTLLATKCGIKSGDTLRMDERAWRYDLRARLLTMAHKLVAGSKQADPAQRTLARSLLADAGRLGSPGAWLELAKLAWESDGLAAECLEALNHARDLGDFSAADVTLESSLRLACQKPK